MFTIIDYIKYYKNKSFNELAWNDMDNLLTAIYSYMPLEEFHEETPFKDVIERICELNLKDSWLMAYKVSDISHMLKSSTRYKDVVITDFTKRVDDKTQFGAVTFRINDFNVVAFEGTDGCVIGWYENFKIMYEYPTFTQNLAIEYLSNMMNKYDGSFVVTGHSKGGNMAICASMEQDDELYKRIKKVYNFDGPGFTKEIFESEKYKRVIKKLTTVLPTTSYIGSIMYSTNKIIPVESTESGAYVHFPTSWEVFGTEFVKSKLSTRSKYIMKTTTTGFELLDKKKEKIFWDAIFEDIMKNSSSKFKMGFKDIKAALARCKKSSMGFSVILYDIFDVLTVSDKKIKKRK